jgi:hypothetical protein
MNMKIKIRPEDKTMDINHSDEQFELTKLKRSIE